MVFKVSLGICAYNEEKNIGRLLEAILKQKLKQTSLEEIVVISSASTDKTDEIVRQFAQKDPRVKLLTQKARHGKASAINLFLKKARGDIIILESADTIPLPETIKNLIKPFADKKVGMVGGRPIPLNQPDTFIGFTVQLIWHLHHQLSLKSPKAGELVAFRNLVKQIPKDTATDEAWIESVVTKAGYRLAYASEAIINNRGPENLSELVRQRKRIFIGHLHLQDKQHYAPLTMNTWEVLGQLGSELAISPRRLLWLLGAMLVEGYCRLAAWVDFFLLGKNPFAWEISESTKEV